MDIVKLTQMSSDECLKLVKRLKPLVSLGMQRSLSQSHLSEPTLAGGGFQRSYSGVAENRPLQTLQPPVRSREQFGLTTR